MELGLGTQDSSLPAEFALYDPVLGTATGLGAVPSRFANLADDEGRPARLPRRVDERVAPGHLGVQDETQLHTHLCYSEFDEVVSAVDAPDADVTSIEAARSRMEVLTDLEAAGFSRDIAPGVWDSHSPRVPSQEETEGLLERALWINPDCGLKTRGYAETRASLEHLMAAARTVREQLAEQTGPPLLVQHGAGT